MVQGKETEMELSSLKETSNKMSTACADISEIPSHVIGWSDSPVQINKETVSFNANGLLKLNQAFTEHVELQNTSNSPVSVTIYCPPETEEHFVTCNPPQCFLSFLFLFLFLSTFFFSHFFLSVEIAGHGKFTVDVVVVLMCTKKLLASVHFDFAGFGNSKMMVSAESEPTSILCYDELVKKKKLGEGGFVLISFFFTCNVMTDLTGFTDMELFTKDIIVEQRLPSRI